MVLAAWAGTLLSLGAAPVAESSARGGLPNAFAKLAAGGEVRIAYLGGSITAAHGWRPMTLEWFGRQYPKAKIQEINAAVSGTGSSYGAARLGRDVLRHKPDLLFVEFAVNDGAESVRVETQMEGIVRQTWAANPATDICFVYTISQSMLKDVQAGKLQAAARSMERVAAHYGIPAFNFGVEIARQATAGTLVFSAPASVVADKNGKDPSGRMIFTRDSTHPTEAGHRLYTERLTRVLPEFGKTDKPGPHTMPAPLNSEHWQRARIVMVAETTHDELWQELPPNDGRIAGQRELAPPTWLALEPGAAVEFRFRGTVCGIIGLKGPDNGEFRMTIDDLPPETSTLFDRYSTPGHYMLKPWFYSKPLADKEHKVRLEILPTRIDKAAIMKAAGIAINDPKPYAGNGLYLSGFLIVGEPIGTKPPPAEKNEFDGIPVLKAGEQPPGYKLVWGDEFDGDKLNTAQWIYRTGLRYWSVQLPENVSVHDGNLWLACRKQQTGTNSYTAGGVISKRIFRYGYYESRFKVPPTKGWHTSFWLMRNTEANRSGHEGSRQEIDICENDSSRLMLYGANLHQWAPEHRGLGHRNVKTPDESADFHTWACEFTPQKIVYYFDGKPVLVNDVTKLPDHGDMSVWLTTIAAPLGATSNVDESRLPVYAVYDYIRVYEKK